MKAILKIGYSRSILLPSFDGLEKIAKALAKGVECDASWDAKKITLHEPVRVSIEMVPEDAVLLTKSKEPAPSLEVKGRRLLAAS